MKQYRRYFPRVQIRSTVFIFVTVSITSLYNGGLKNENFVVKIARQNKESEKGLLNTNKQKTNTRTYINQRDIMLTKTRN
jgi:hypothetical protein